MIASDTHLHRIVRGRRAAGFALALALVAAPAGATTYYASPNGSSTNTGLSQLSPWSLSKANSSLAAGDVCILLPGSYGSAISPAASGTGPNSRITYVGSIANPANTVVTALEHKQAWITIKGVTANGELGLNYPARYDSIAWCVGTSGGHFYGAKYSTIAHNTISGPFAFLLDLAQTISGTSNCEYDTLRLNSINIGLVPATHGFKIRGYTQNCLIDSNQVTGTFTQNGANDGCGRIFYNSSYNTLRDNSWRFEATNAYNANNDAWNGFVMRDSASHYTFLRDTCSLGLASAYPVRGVLCSSGTYPASVGDNVWQNCIMKTNAYIWVQNGLRRVTLRNDLFASSSNNALWCGSSFEGSTIDHCTFYSTGQVVSYGDQFLSSGNTITSNVFYSGNVGPVGTGGCMLQFASNATSNFTQNYNLYFTASYTSSPGDRDLEWCCYTGSKVGAGTPWAQLNGQDVNSSHGSPMFVDSTFASLDAHLRSGSLAIGRGQGGTDAGAYPFGGAQTDVTPPSAVANLDTASVSQNGLLLVWTAPGDDGNVGVAQLYDLRYSTSPITDANFASATPANPQPTPAYAGSLQQYVVTGLQPTTTYYFAIKARDEAGNWSALSNVASATTHALDTTPPAAITDLSAGP